MRSTALLSALLAFASFAARAITPGASPRREGDDPPGRPGRALFRELKAIESYSHLERIRILQEAEACIEGATNRDRYRACERREAGDRDRVKEQVKLRREALRARAARLGQASLAAR
ncbi:MAG TPA: hypothetical protein PK375_06745 [Rhodocyclaceae bacterium]|nr:hypothetical protein [Rhodocyclaceae bacterium]